MNIIFIFDGNDYQFDVSSNVSIKYIKKLAQRIFEYEEKGYDLLFNEENLNNYNENFKINQLIQRKENSLTFHLEKKDSTAKNTLVSSNESTNDSNNNDKYYKLMRKKFFKFDTTYSQIIEEISTFEQRLEEILESLKRHINDFKINILNVNETLHYFYNSESHDKLISIFEEFRPQGLNRNDLEYLNKEIESYILNYKFLTTQHNFQINILDFLIEKKDIFKFVKNKLFEVQNHNNYEEIVLLLDHIFSELTTTNSSKIPLSNNSDYFHYEKGQFLNINEKNKDLSFPKINTKNKRGSSLNVFSNYSNNKKSVNCIKLIKNKNEISQNNSFSSIFKKVNNTEKQIPNKFPYLENKSFEGKTFNFISPNSNNSKSLKNINKSSYLLNELNSKYKSNSKIKDLDITSLVNEVKPKIMEKNNIRLKQINYRNMDIPVNKTMNNIHNYIEYSNIYEKKETKNISLNDSLRKDKMNSKSLNTERNHKEIELDKNSTNNKKQRSSIIKEKDLENNEKNIKNERNSIIKEKLLDKSFKLEEKKRSSITERNYNEKDLDKSFKLKEKHRSSKTQRNYNEKDLNKSFKLEEKHRSSKTERDYNEKDLNKSFKLEEKHRSSKTERDYNEKDLDKSFKLNRKERSSIKESNYKERSERREKSTKNDRNIIEKELEHHCKIEIIDHEKDNTLKLKEKKKYISNQEIPFIKINNNNKIINTDITLEKGVEKDIKPKNENKYHKEKENKENIVNIEKIKLSPKEDLKKINSRKSTTLINPTMKTEYSMKEINIHRRLTHEKLSEKLSKPSNTLKSNLKKVDLKEEIIKQRKSKIINFTNDSSKKETKDDIIINFIKDETSKTVKEKMESRKSRDSKKTYKTDIHQIDDDDSIIHKKEKENNKEQIERLTKDLLPKNNNKLNSQNKEMLFKHTDLKDFIRHTLNLDKTEKKENDNQNKDNKTEEEILLKEEEIEDNDEQIQKKKKKHINKYDFII